ncbi:MAG: FkbM family methyltransferase [Nitrospira sp.]|nr:FkbM family methyltransferase [Nitrospira sp.]
MDLRANIRKNFPRTWALFRAAKTVPSRIVHFFCKRRWAENEIAYSKFLCSYAERVDDFFFIQVGANDGIRNDPLHQFVTKYKWSGVLVEPQSALFARLQETYSGFQGLYFENAAVCDSPGSVVLNKVKDSCMTESYHNGIATICPKRGAIRGIPLAHVEQIEVPAITLSSLVSKYSPVRWDLLQIDTEGYDFEIIKLVDFSKQIPLIIRYEKKHLPLRERQKCRRLLRQNGYSLIDMDRDTVGIHKRILSQEL